MRLVWGLVPWLCLLATPGGQGPPPPPAAPAPPVICWQEGRKLRWEDFQAPKPPVLWEGQLKPGHIIGANTEAEAVVYDLTTNYGRYVKTFVRVEFHPQKSWVNTVDLFDRAAALKHEQLHFDIIELTGRKIRRVLARCAAQHLNYNTPAITQEITNLYKEEVQLDNRYDKEASSGDNPKAQARWNAYIKQQLARLRVYKSTPADCELPR